MYTFSSTNEAIDDFMEKVMNQVDGKLLYLDESNFNKMKKKMHVKQTNKIL